MDKSTVNGYLIYTHCGLDTNSVLTVKCISITLNTLAWTLTVFNPGSGGASGGIPTVTASDIENPTDKSENLVYYNGSVYCLIKED